GGIGAGLPERAHDAIGIDPDSGADADDSLELHHGHSAAAGKAALVEHGEHQPHRAEEERDHAERQARDDSSDAGAGCHPGLLLVVEVVVAAAALAPLLAAARLHRHGLVYDGRQLLEAQADAPLVC